jgi:hypothetical protein
MTAGLLRRLFSMDFLVGDGHARLDEWGSRAVLRESASVGSWPGVVALTGEGRSMSHGELDEASNGLEHLLIDQGAGIGMRLTLCWKHATREALSGLMGERNEC